MESAIPKHLQCPRSRQSHKPADYEPPYPAWTARLPEALTQITMAYLGVQCPKGKEGAALATVAALVHQLGLKDPAAFHDIAHYTDEAGYPTWMVMAYWPSVEAFQRWQSQPEVANWWNAPARSTEGLGHFREVFTPHVTHFETLFSNDRFEGAAHMASGRSDEIREHGYWGGMRDRLPSSQTDAMASPANAHISELPAPAKGRVKLQGHDNIALIRSGQEWTETTGKERDQYLKDIEPTLRAGMDFLRDKGSSIGCYFNRFVQLVDVQGKPVEKSFGMSLWHTLEHMEAWSESHITHVNIFGKFMKMVSDLGGPNLKLRLYHEVTVLQASEQSYEYVNCHPHTGLLNTLAPAAKL